jgi:tRNA pseudouridine55 synthase
MSARPEGLLLVDKPAGMTSHDVVMIVRRVYGEKSIGHLGTLDPFATGLLILLIGRVTRLANFIVTDPKVYEAGIEFGAETDTDDSTVIIVRQSDPPSQDAVDTAIRDLTGRLMQTPPDYSAKSIEGVRAYDAARNGVPLALAPVEVDVLQWEVRSRDAARMEVTITCGGGTYIRALARDLGRMTESAAHLTSLRRIRSGEFDVAQAATVDRLKSDPPPLRPLAVVAL